MIARTLVVVVAFGCSSSSPSRVGGESPAPGSEAAPVPAAAATPTVAANDAQRGHGAVTSKELGLDSKLAPWLDGPWYESWAELAFQRVKVCVPKPIGRSENDSSFAVFESGPFQADCEKAPNVGLTTQRGKDFPTKDEVSESVVSGSRVHRVVHTATEGVVVSDFKWFRQDAPPDGPKTTAWLVTFARVSRVGGQIIWCTAKCGTLKESAVQAIGRALEPICASLIESTNQKAVWEPDGACARIGR
jgi:hypothetical protein